MAQQSDHVCNSACVTLRPRKEPTSTTPQTAEYPSTQGEAEDMSTRPRRHITKTQRAKESGQFVPGIDSTIAQEARSLSPALSELFRTSISSVTSQVPLGVEKRSIADSISKHDSQSQDHTEALNRLTPVSLDQKPETHIKVEDPEPETPVRARKQSKTKAHRGTKSEPHTRGRKKESSANKAPDLLTTLGLQIYAWPVPYPTRFINLEQRHRTWKEAQDKQEGNDDRDAELDDWHEVCGRPGAYALFGAPRAFHYSITRSFILRAKRAFRSGMTWDEFEDVELAIDSTARAYSIADPELRELHLSEALNNDLRLSIFDQIKKRLCNEVWLEEYVEITYPELE